MRLSLDGAVYGISAVKKAAYRFMDRFATDIQVEGGRIVCDITFARAATETEQDALVADFRCELLDQDLRERIGAETQPVRNAILAIAFSPVTERGH